MAAESLAGVGVHGAGKRVRLDHAAIAVGGQQHRPEGQQVGRGQVPFGHLGDQPIGGEHRQRDHVGKAEQHQRGQPHGFAEST
ncbi:hypothetical protein D3C81_1993290 [compost metagenome]